MIKTLIPRISEKGYKLSQERNTYIFEIPENMNRVEVAKAVKAQFAVDAVSVKIAVIKGKAMRFIRKGGKVNTGTRANVKKAYVRLTVGQSLPFYAAIDEAIEADAKAEAKVPTVEKKRGLFGRKNEKATNTANVSAKVTRTQAMVGEK
jgi:ribosomal protein L23